MKIKTKLCIYAILGILIIGGIIAVDYRSEKTLVENLIPNFLEGFILFSIDPIATILVEETSNLYILKTNNSEITTKTYNINKTDCIGFSFSKDEPWAKITHEIDFKKAGVWYNKTNEDINWLGFDIQGNNTEEATLVCIGEIIEGGATVDFNISYTWNISDNTLHDRIGGFLKIKDSAIASVDVDDSYFKYHLEEIKIDNTIDNDDVVWYNSTGDRKSISLNGTTNNSKFESQLGCRNGFNCANGSYFEFQDTNSGKSAFGVIDPNNKTFEDEFFLLRGEYPNAKASMIQHGGNLNSGQKYSVTMWWDDPSPPVEAFNGSNVVYRCGYINVTGTYTMNQSLSTTTGCLTINVDDISLDCQDFNIDGDDGGTDYGIFVDGGVGSELTNISVNNCYITDFNRGVYFDYVENSSINNATTNSNAKGIQFFNSDSNILTNITTKSNIDYGIFTEDSNLNNFTNIYAFGNVNPNIRLINSNYNIITHATASGGGDEGVYVRDSNFNVFLNITVTSNGNSATEGGVFIINSDSNNFTNITSDDNTGRGISIDSNSNSNIINYSIIKSSSIYGIDMAGSNNYLYNNLFNNSVNIFFSGTPLFNNWNITKQSGTRIYSSGTDIGGNYYTNPTGTGFSDTCQDSNLDGFCDLGYNVTNNVACTIGTDCSTTNADFLAYTFKTPPNISFIDPTPPNATNSSNTYVEINVSIEETNLNEVIYNWDGTNYTMYNDSLVLMLNLDNLSALGENNTHVFDASSYGNNATISTATFNTSGRFNGNFKFDELTDKISGSLAGNPVSDRFTISIWVKFDELGVQQNYIGVGNPSVDRVIPYITSGNELYCYIQGSPTVSNMASGVTVTTGIWYYTTCSYNGTHGNVYVNGEWKNSHSNTDTVITTNNYVIGEDLGGSFDFNGTLDEPRIWSRALSGEEIQQNYFANLRKLDSDSWELYVNQSKNSTDGLENGTYTYYSWANDNFNDMNSTETRWYTVGEDIEDTTPPIFTTIPDNVSDAYLIVNVNADFDADDNIAISGFFLNDTTDFSIGFSSGILTNNSVLDIGNYALNVTVNDTSNNINWTIFTVEVTQNVGTCQVLFNETSPLNFPLTFTAYTDCNSDFTLRRNGTIVTNNTEQSLAASSYNFSVQRTDTVNFSNTYDDEEFRIISVPVSDYIFAVYNDAKTDNNRLFGVNRNGFTKVNGNLNVSENLTVGNTIFLDFLKKQFIKKNTIPTVFNGIAEDAFWFGHEEIKAEGEIAFMFTAENKTLLWNQVGRNNSYSGLGNSLGVVPNYWGEENFTSGGMINMTKLSDYPFICNFFGKPCRFLADTRGRSGALLWTSGDLEVWRTANIMEGISVTGPADYSMDENDFNIFNGSIHNLIPTTFESGFLPGDSFTILNIIFQGSINPFVNEDVSPEIWFTTSGALCDEGECAEATGSTGSVDITMSTNYSSQNVNETEINFVYSLVGLIGSDELRVEVNNFNGSGWLNIFTDAGTETVVSQRILLDEGYSNLSAVGLRFVCDVTQPLRSCFVDSLIVNGTFTANTTATVNGFDSEFCGSDGTRDVNGDCNRGLRYDAESDQWIFAGTLNASIAGGGGGGITGSGTATNWMRWTGSTSAGNAPASDDGSLITFTLDLLVNGFLNITGNIFGQNLNVTGDVCIDGGNCLSSVSGGSQTKVNNITCAGNDKVSAYDNVTGDFICTTDQTAAGGLSKNTTGFYLYNDSVTIYFNDTINNITINTLISDNNVSVNNFIIDINSTQSSWTDLFFVRFTELVDQIGNWSADKDNYVLGTELNNGTYIIDSILNNGTYTGGSDTTWVDNWTAYNTTWSTDTNTFNTSQEMWDAVVNGSVVLDSILNNGSYFSASETDPFWSANFTNHVIDCPSGNYTYGAFDNGTRKCRDDTSAAYDDAWINQTIYNKTQVDDINTSNNNYIDFQDIAFNNSIVNWILDQYYTITQVDAMNISNNNYINEVNISVTNTFDLYALLTTLNNGTYTGGSGDATWVANYSAYNITWTNSFNSTTNTSITNTFTNYYTKSESDAINTSNNNYIDAQDLIFNNSIVNWILDQYYTITQVDAMNISNNNYILDNNNSVNNNIATKRDTSNFTFSQSINLTSSNNITIGNTGGRYCLNWDCSSNIYNNGTHSIWN